MSKADDYRMNAAETVQLAQRAATTLDKGRLLKLAEAWLDLAERTRRATRNIRRPRYLHRSFAKSSIPTSTTPSACSGEVDAGSPIRTCAKP